MPTCRQCGRAEMSIFMHTKKSLCSVCRINKQTKKRPSIKHKFLKQCKLVTGDNTRWLEFKYNSSRISKWIQTHENELTESDLIRFLNIKNYNISIQDFGMLEKTIFSQLEMIRIKSCRSVGAMIPSIVSHMHHLSDLRLNGVNLIDSDLGIIIDSINELHMLDIGTNEFVGTALPRLKNVKILKMQLVPKITASNLAAFAKNTTVEELHSSTLYADRRFLLGLAKNEHLRRLYLQETKCSPVAIGLFVDALKDSKLEILEFYDNNMNMEISKKLCSVLALNTTMKDCTMLPALNYHRRDILYADHECLIVLFKSNQTLTQFRGLQDASRATLLEDHTLYDLLHNNGVITSLGSFGIGTPISKILSRNYANTKIKRMSLLDRCIRYIIERALRLRISFFPEDTPPEYCREIHSIMDSRSPTFQIAFKQFNESREKKRLRQEQE